MQNIITQVTPEGGNINSPILQQEQGYGQQQNSEYYENSDDAYGNSLIHLNIQENHYFITRDQLMSLPESLLLCLFPSGVFLDRDGQVISNLTPEDEVYIVNFPPECFEYIMEVFTTAHDDLINHPVEKLFERTNNSISNNGLMNSAKGFFGIGNNNNNNISNNTQPNTQSNKSAASISTSTENDLLHQKPVIIVLREDLDYYCVPQEEFKFDSSGYDNLTIEQQYDNNDDLLHHFMAQIKIAAGSYLSQKTSIFQGLFSSNRLKYQNSKTNNNSNNKQASKNLGPAEQHLMDMLCSSGFTTESIWGNRTQETGKTVISSLSLCRLSNESTQEFRDKLTTATMRWQKKISLQDQINNNGNEDFINGNATNNSSSSTIGKGNKLTPSASTKSLLNIKSSPLVGNNKQLKTSTTTSGISNSLTNVNSNNNNNNKKEKRKSRFSSLADSVRSSSGSRANSLIRNNSNSNSNIGAVETPGVYDLVPKPDINAKLLLFWRKPARKCWWGDEEIDLDVEIYGDWIDKEKKIIKLKLPTSENIETELNKISVSVRLHIRRVWTLELSVVGVQ